MSHPLTVTAPVDHRAATRATYAAFIWSGVAPTIE